jgi:hypothetical protein
MKRLRIPITLGVVVLGAASAIVASCHGTAAVQDAAVCEIFCIQAAGDAGVCLEQDGNCTDAGPICPPNCEPVA